MCGADAYRTLGRAALLAVGAPLLGCHSGEGLPLVTVRDSADVRIVEYSRSPGRDAADWWVSPDPEVVVGRETGAPEGLLTNPITALGRGDGGIVVRDSYNGFFAIKYYGAAGDYQKTVARWGQGPYEFQFPLGAHRLDGDSLLVVKRDGGYAVFGPSGEPAREGRLSVERGRPLARSHYLGGGSLVVEELGGSERVPDGMSRPRRRFRLATLAGTTSFEFAAELGAPIWSEAVRRGSLTGTRSYAYPFAPQTSVAGGDSGFWLARADLPNVRRYATSGRLDTWLRFPDRSVPLDDSERRAYRSAILESGTAGGASRALEKMGFPRSLPFFGRVETDRDGNLWLQRYQIGPPADAELWDVFLPDGTWIATAAFDVSLVPRCAYDPRLLEPCDWLFEIGRDYVLLGMEDSLGRRFVGKYPIHRR